MKGLRFPAWRLGGGNNTSERQIIAIIVEAYMKVATDVANMESDEEFVSDVTVWPLVGVNV